MKLLISVHVIKNCTHKNFLWKIFCALEKIMEQKVFFTVLYYFLREKNSEQHDASYYSSKFVITRFLSLPIYPHTQYFFFTFHTIPQHIGLELVWDILLPSSSTDTTCNQDLYVVRTIFLNLNTAFLSMFQQRCH